MPIIVLEGINGAGKSTAGNCICEALGKEGKSCVLIDAAGYGRIGRLLRRQIVLPEVQSTPDFDAMLFSTLRVEGALRIPQILQKEPATIILLERWSLALGAYGAADGARPGLVSELRAVLDGALTIDATILMDVSGKIAFKRIESEAGENRFESKGPEFLERVAEAHRKLALSMVGVVVVDAAGTIDATFNRVLATLRSKLKM
ncbi:MAG: dTMP kinase [Verrucomicrobiota bacterium]